MTTGEETRMNRKQWLTFFLTAGVMGSLLGGCAPRATVTEDMIPTVTDLRLEEVQETVPQIIALSMNKSYMAELIRRDGDNTEMASVDVKEIPVVLKATSVDKDLKVKIVNKRNDRVITGTRFEVSVTDANSKTNSYTDEDADGIIHIKKMEPGKCKISMKKSGAYVAPEDITAEVKANIAYEVVDVTDEIKKESEINVSKEDANTTGNAGAGTAEVLKDTVEFVASTKTEMIEEVQEQKKDAFGQLMFSKLKTDKYGTEMYTKILSEPEADHKDENQDSVCDRCSAQMAKPHTHSYTIRTETKAATCLEKGAYEEKCECGDVQTGELDALGHLDENADNVCDRCTAALETSVKPTAAPDTDIPDEETPSQNQQQDEGEVSAAASVRARIFQLLATAMSEQSTSDKIVYDKSSAPVYDETSEPVYEMVKKVTGYRYTGWQTLDGATYYFDKNGKKVTGSQVIQGIQYTFSSEGVRSGTIGIDVSKYQPSVNWKKVKNAGINFVIIRCGYRGYGSGVLVEDPMFASHITGAKAAGLRVGVYFFSQAITEAEAVEEASMAVKLANRYGINMPIAIDSEYANGGAGRADRLSKSERTKITIAFCNTVANAGHRPMVYASKSWFSDHLNVSQFPGSYRIWVAHYAAKCGYTGRYDIWQNTSKGKVDGIPGNVDMNISSI